MRHLQIASIALTPWLFAACSDGASERPNLAPSVSLAVPERALSGAAIRFDASSSFDPDGAIVSYRFLFGDGSAESRGASPHTTHRYLGPGIYEVAVVATDEAGASGRATAFVHVVPVVPCDSVLDCGDGERCAAGICEPVQCASDDECPAGQVCEEGACLAPPCDTDSDCGDDEICRDGRCAPACPVGITPCGTTTLLCGEELVCVARCCIPPGDGPRLLRSLPNPMAPELAIGLAWDGSTLWAVGSAPTLYSIDRLQGGRVRHFSLGASLQTTGMAALEDKVYLGVIDVGAEITRRILPIPTATGGVEAPIEGASGGLAPAGPGELWSLVSLTRRLRRIRVLDGTVLDDLDFAATVDAVGDLAGHAGRIWAVVFAIDPSGSRVAQVVEIDPATAVVVDTFVLPEDLAFGLTHDGESLWVAGSARLYQLYWP